MDRDARAAQTRVVIEEQRPVPLEHHYLVGHRAASDARRAGRRRCCRTPTSSRSTSEEVRVDRYRRVGATRTSASGRPREGHRASTCRGARRSSRCSQDAGMLPAIYFVFSRAGCDRSVRVARGVRDPPDDARGGRPDPRAGGDARRLDRRGRPRRRSVSTTFLEALHGRASPRTTPGCCRCSRRPWRSCSRPAWSRSCSRRRRSRSGSTCRRKTVVIEDLWKFQGERHELAHARASTRS